LKILKTFLSRPRPRPRLWVPRPRPYFCPRGASRPRPWSRGLHHCTCLREICDPTGSFVLALITEWLWFNSKLEAIRCDRPQAELEVRKNFKEGLKAEVGIRTIGDSHQLWIWGSAVSSPSVPDEVWGEANVI